MSRWQSDPHALGSYSFPAVGAHPDDHDALGGREGPSLHFAGEACSAYPGTVHGAYLSGLAAAKSLLAS